MVRQCPPPSRASRVAGVQEMTAAGLAARVGAKRVGQEYRVICPAHPDKDPSLDFRDGNKGIVLTCRSRNCSNEDILAAWDLAFADIMHEGTSGTYQPAIFRSSTLSWARPLWLGPLITS